MTSNEAHQILKLVEDQWRRPIGASRPFWTATLKNYDWQEGINAVGYLAERNQYCPTLAELRQVLNMQRAKGAAALPPAQPPVQMPGKTPDWVNIWGWMRLQLKDFRALPQQGGTADVLMSQEEYDELRERWVAAGSPRLTSDELVAAMQANARAKQQSSMKEKDGQTEVRVRQGAATGDRPSRQSGGSAKAS